MAAGCGGKVGVAAVWWRLAGFEVCRQLIPQPLLPPDSDRAHML